MNDIPVKGKKGRGGVGQNQRGGSCGRHIMPVTRRPGTNKIGMARGGEEYDDTNNGPRGENRDPGGGQGPPELG
jgi:hypothetical protein